MSLPVATITAALLAQTLTLDTVLERARELHPTIAAADADVDVGRGEVLAADGAFDPMLRASARGEAGTYQAGLADAGLSLLTPVWGTSVSGGYRLGLGDYPIYDGKRKTNDGGEFRLGARLPLLRDREIDSARGGLALRQNDLERRSRAADRAIFDIQRAALSAYADWLAAGAALDVADELLGLATLRDEQLTQRARVGDVPALELSDNARLVAQRRSRQVGARRSLERTALTLSLFIRDDNGQPQLPERTALPKLAVVHDGGVVSAEQHKSELDQALRARPELQELQAQLAVVDTELALADNALLPSLALSGAVSQDVGPTHAPLSSSSSVWAPDAKTRDLPEASLDLSFEMPVLLRQARGRREAALAVRARTLAQLRLLQDRVAVEVMDARSAITAAEERFAAATAAQAAASVVLEGEKQRYDAGDSTLVVVNLREEALAEARLQVKEAEVEVVRARAALLLMTTPIVVPR